MPNMCGLKDRSFQESKLGLQARNAKAKAIAAANLVGTLRFTAAPVELVDADAEVACDALE